MRIKRGSAIHLANRPAGNAGHYALALPSRTACKQTNTSTCQRDRFNTQYCNPISGTATQRLTTHHCRHAVDALEAEGAAVRLAAGSRVGTGGGTKVRAGVLKGVQQGGPFIGAHRRPIPQLPGHPLPALTCSGGCPAAAAACRPACRSLLSLRCPAARSGWAGSWWRWQQRAAR